MEPSNTHVGEVLAAGADDPQRSAILRHAEVVTLDPDRPRSERSDVFIRGSRIEAVGADLGHLADENTVVVDLTEHIVLPGFIDCHVHAWEGVFRGAVPDASFPDYMAFAHLACAPLMTPDEMRVGQQLTAVQAINAGATTIVDNSHNTKSVEHALAAMDGLRSTGIRAVFAAGAPAVDTDPEKFLSTFAELRSAYPDDDELLTLRLFSPMPSRGVFEFARATGVGVSAELVLGVPVPQLGLPAAVGDFFGEGLIGADDTFNHCIGVSARQWSELRDVGAGVNVSPRSDPHFGIGPAFPPVLQAQASGAVFGISSDNEVCYGLDFFTEMRTLLTLQRSAAFARLNSSSGEQAISPFGTLDTLRAATSGGAPSVGMPGRLGMLKAGLPADLIAVNTGRLHLRPRGDAVGTVVNFCTNSDIDVVFVNGTLRKWGEGIIGTDVARTIAEAERCRERVLGAVNTA
ncbi:amidohydrolase family protein [Streptomyces sp. FXY-T5]|uniref:amidohydrolase family protein n=1 Tax=Streptomyces sp. FXY-T5 TaxID=3064901 RepID=UPI0027D29A46|nr:amidohydrolase family protein [Streptomyces sp. FXY-T5]WMD07138.1 amidohydrolase family protein [Streptomyces sp. FXY-T5]